MEEQSDAERLVDDLKQFTGSVEYTTLTKNVVLTEGALYLAEHAACYWLFDLYASHLFSINKDVEEFTCLKLSKTDNSASVTIDDGNGRVLAEQHVEYTDFPLTGIKLYGCWSGDYWVLMLPSEY